MIHNGLAKMCRRFSEAQAGHTPLKVSLLYRCLMADVICEYAFGESFHFLDNLSWSEGFFSATETTMKGGWLFRESKLVNYISMSLIKLPEWLFSRKSMQELAEWSKVRVLCFNGQTREIRHLGFFPSSSSASFTCSLNASCFPIAFPIYSIPSRHTLNFRFRRVCLTTCRLCEAASTLR